MQEIRFNKVNEPYGFFSNFSPHPIYLDSTVWATTEHYFQASKFNDQKLISKILRSKSPMEAANIGRNPENIIVSDWELIKEQVMYKAITAKFLQYPELKTELLKTEDAVIIEHTFRDNYWGNGGDDNGKNKLGILLMKLREYIKTISYELFLVFPPWVAYPGISQYDGFWRMGLGEEYLSKWSKYYLNINDKKKYTNFFPEDSEWQGIYEW